MLTIVEEEYPKLQEILRNCKIVDPASVKLIRAFQKQLQSAALVSQEKAADTLVRLYSRVDVETAFGRKVGLLIVPPEEGDMSQRKLSILNPLGLAIFGKFEKDYAVWSFPQGNEHVQIDGVKSPVILST